LISQRGGQLHFLNLAFLPHTFTSNIRDHVFVPASIIGSASPRGRGSRGRWARRLHNWSGFTLA